MGSSSTWLALVWFVSATAMPINVEARSMQVPEDVRTAIGQVLSDEVAAWNHGDATAFAARTTDHNVTINARALAANPK